MINLTLIKRVHKCVGEVKVPTVTVSPCHEFSCVSGECISKSKMCDDHNDCSDASDESYFLCSHKYQDIKKKPVIYKPKHISYDKGNLIIINVIYLFVINVFIL